jgi:hypothetical protein
MRGKEHETPLRSQSTGPNSMAGFVGGSRCEFVVLQQSANRLVADDVLQAELMDWIWLWQSSIYGHIAEPLVRPTAVMNSRPLVQNLPQMAFAEDDELVQTLCQRAAHPRLRLEEK